MEDGLLMGCHSVDISENFLSEFDGELLAILLRDHTTQRNITWATRDYEHLGKGYQYGDEILPEKITGENSRIIMPRVLKPKKSQTQRSKKMAEVFTPSWICNLQNNLVDGAWFGRKNVFNTETTEDGGHSWVPSDSPITDFPEGKSWKSYVTDTRLEITCGEAPYIVSRYDATTGQFIPVNQRIGLLDRKLRLVGENCHEEGEWLQFARKAIQNVLGFEWQGDSLLLARENVFVTMIEYYKAKFGEDRMPQKEKLKVWADIASWNFWQMDGLTSQLPNAPKKKYKHRSLFEEDNETFCKIMDWDEGEVIYFESLKKQYRDK